jgi:O-6-methylguanine DNA methyltransferase
MYKYAFYNFELGILKITYTDTAVTALKRMDNIDEKNEHSSLSDIVFLQIQEYFSGKRTTFNFPYELHGTEFQKKIWSALCEIPYGETCTYKSIAISIGNPKASRAVGMANSKNPIGIVVPCHRVIGASGKLVGYAGGLDMKKTLIDLENKYKK